MYNEFLEVVENNKVKYHLYNYDLVIDAEINMCDANINCTELFFSCGKITIWDDSKIEKCIRPDNLIIECKHCFRLYNQYGDCIGYIYVE